MSDELLMDVSREDLEKLAAAIAETSVETKGPQVIATIDVLDLLDLELIATSVGGINDPLGQLRQFLEDLVKSAAEWIVNTLGGLISQLFDSLYSFLNTAFSGITTALDAIASGLSAVVDLITQVVVDPILQALQWVSEAFPQLVDLFQQAIDAITSAIEGIGGIVTSIIDMISERLMGLAEQVLGLVQSILDALSGVAEAIGQIVEAVQKIFESIVEAASGVISAIQDALTRLLESLTPIIEGIVDAIAGIADVVQQVVANVIEALGSIINMIQPMVDAITTAFQSIIDTITTGIQTVMDVLSTLASRVHELFTGLLDTVSRIISGIIDAVSGMVSTIMDVLGQIPGMIQGMIQSIVDTLSSAFQAIVDMLQPLMDAIAGLASLVGSMVGTIIDYFEQLAGYVSTAVEQVVTSIIKIGDTVQSTLAVITESLSGFVSRLQDMLAGIAATVAQHVHAIVDTISGALQQLADTVTNTSQAIAEALATILDAIQAFPEQMNKAIASAQEAISQFIQQVMEGIHGVAKQVADILNSIVKALTELPQYVNQAFEVIRDFLANLPDYAAKLIEDITGFVWENLPDWAKRFFEEAPKALERVAVALTGFINAILKFPEWFPKWFYDYIAKPIVDAIGAVAAFFQTIMDLASRIVAEGPGFILDIAKRVGRASVDYVAGIIRFGFELLEMARDYVEEIAKRVSDLLVEPIAELIESLFRAMRTGFRKIMDGESIVSVYTDFFKAIVPYTVSSVALPEFMRAIGEEVTRFTSMALQYAMQGGGAEGAPLIALANTIEKGAWGVVSQLPWSIAFWMAEPLRKPLEYATRYAMRNELPIEIPTLTMIRDMIRRSMATKEGPKVYEWIIQFAKLRGYSDAILELLYSLEKPVTKVMDRFGGIREIPLSLLWDVPTRSDLVRMLQRDVFASPMEWARFIIVHGLNEDLGKMYYMMSFEYPSFTQLWEFFVRGISGMLWYQAPEFIKAWFAKDAEWLGAGIPVDPKKLNYDYNALFKAIPFYMKWIQKSNFSWFRKGAKIQYGDLVINIDFDWTADSWMLWDIAADLPGKIDARWMAKWALFDLISLKAGVGVPQPGQAIDAYPEVPFVDLVTQVVEDTMASSIYMDLRAFSRLLVANGLHPAWVPITAVAEAINALSEERTLLRTGFINLFKEGFWDYKTIDVLLDGFFVASFAVEYFDPTERKWKAGAINVPIKFLPGERRLLELRAAMDRALDILRDLVKELNRSYAEHIVITYEEYLAHLKEGIDLTNEWFKPLIKELTGKELELGADMAYWGAYAKVVEMYRELYTMRRIRYWIGRIITWSIYRLAAEYITVEDVKMIVGMFSQYGKLTNQEVEMLEKIMEVMVGIAKREYIPTPSMLATIAEVVPEAVKMMQIVFEKRHVPEEWRPIWAKYIEVKPIVGDVRSLLTAYRRAKVYGVELGELEKTILELAKATGWTDRELEILALRIRVEELIEETKELRRAYLPTPMMLATLAEYVHVPIDLVKKTLEARRVPEEWIEIWLRYIEVRPLADEARMLATVFFKAKRYGVPLGELEQQVLAILKELGFTERELQLRQLRATIEAMIDQWREAQREYIPTPSMLATIAEVVPMARMLAEKVFEARNVPVEWRGIWLQYIQLKPVMDEVRRYVSIVLTMYEYFTIPRGELVKALEAVRAFGYEDIEIQFLVARADLERALRAYRELIGTPRQLITMAEYSPTARRVALAEVYKMIDALPTDPQTKEFLKKMWEEYIRVRPVYDEVRRYVTELINDYANGVITREQLASELEELKEWGLDDYEIQFYMWLAEKRRMRYAARYRR